MFATKPFLAFLFAFASVPSSLSFSVNRVFVSTPPQTQQGKLVEDCMSHNPICLKTTDTINDAIQDLLSMGFNGAPVVDPSTGRLVGVISAFDFLQKEEGGTLLPLMQDGDPSELRHQVRAVNKICAKTVGDLMTPIAVTVEPTMSIKEASEIMVRDRCHRLCVVDDKGTLIGILATSDIMRHIIAVTKRIMPEMEAGDQDEPLDSTGLTP